MAFLELVKKRYSVRTYTSKPVPRDILLKCIEAARLAPSACNAQPWRYIIVDKKELVEKIGEEVCSGIYSFNNFVKNAAALIVVVSDKEGFIRKVGSYIKGTNYYLIDIGIACEHLVLQATELGLGTCWIGWFDEKKLKRILNIPRNKRVDVIISLGYYQKIPSTSQSRKALTELVSYNKY